MRRLIRDDMRDLVSSRWDDPANYGRKGDMEDLDEDDLLPLRDELDGLEDDLGGFDD
mgnify:CR=1 FL=1